MKTVWSKEVDEILRIGLPLDDIGVRNWALTRNQALTVLEQLLNLGVSVLGGDVYERIDGVIQSNYDNWHCDMQSGEKMDAFVVRSISKSKAFIAAYKTSNDSNLFFVLVPKL